MGSLGLKKKKMMMLETSSDSPEVWTIHENSVSVVPSLPLISVSRGILPLTQPEPKIVVNSKSINLSGPTDKAHHAVSELEEFWDEDGWGPIAFESDCRTTSTHQPTRLPRWPLMNRLVMMRRAQHLSSLGSQSDIEEPIRQTEVVEESADLGTKRKLYRQPATPLANPVPSTASLLATSQAERYGAFYSGMEMALKNKFCRSSLAYEVSVVG